jgi:hypothetical protein
VIAYRVTLGVPRELAWSVAKLLLAERRRRGTHVGAGAELLWQAVLGLRWFRDRTTAEALARDHGISRATAYRYLDEVITVLAGQAPDLHETPSSAPCANAGSHSPAAGAPCGTSPPAPARSVTLPGPRSC